MRKIGFRWRGKMHLFCIVYREFIIFLHGVYFETLWLGEEVSRNHSIIRFLFNVFIDFYRAWILSYKGECAFPYTEVLFNYLKLHLKFCFSSRSMHKSFYFYRFFVCLFVCFVCFRFVFSFFFVEGGGGGLFITPSSSLDNFDMKQHSYFKLIL